MGSLPWAVRRSAQCGVSNIPISLLADKQKGGEPCRHRAQIWPLHDIAITNAVWCMAHKVGGSLGGAYIAQWACNSIAKG